MVYDSMISTRFGKQLQSPICAAYQRLKPILDTSARQQHLTDPWLAVPPKVMIIISASARAPIKTIFGSESNRDLNWPSTSPTALKGLMRPFSVGSDFFGDGPSADMVGVTTLVPKDLERQALAARGDL